MSGSKPKWLLGATLVAAIVLSSSLMVQAAAPSFTGDGITSPTGASPVYRQPGATFTVTFNYSSDPDTTPRWTKALVQLLDGATLIKEIEETIPSARLDDGTPNPSYTGTASIGMIIPPPPLPGVAEGLYSVKVYLSNSDGGGASVWDQEDDALIIDDTAPGAPGTPSTTSPTTNTTPDWTWAAAADPNIAGGVTPGSGIKGYWVKIGTTSGGSDVLVETWVGNVTNWTTSVALTPDDTYYVSVRAEDNVGNLGDWATGSVLVDTTNPNNPTGLAVTTPTNDRTPEVTWTAATDPGYPDSGSGVVGYQVQIGTSSGAGDVKAWTSVGDITTFDDAAWTALGVTLTPDDDYFFQVRSVDAVGLTSAGAEVQISVDATAPTDPTNLAPDEDPTADTTIEWSWTASTDPVGNYTSGISGYYVKLGTTSGGDEVVAETGIGNVTNYTTPDLTANGSGTYYLSVRAKDVAGNYSGWVTDSVVLDITAPNAPGIPSGTSPTTDTTPTWSWTAASDDHTSIASYNVKIGTSQGGSDVLGVTNIGNFTSWEVDLDPGTPGNQGFTADDTYYLSVQAVDAVGNVSAWSEDPSGILVDTTNPDAPTGLTVTTPTNDRTPEVTWTAAT
ncbi:MAG: hypothetical protein NUW23_00010, partial [Firmicutes bacterium]|nr:hypothetical protein [Bacillota bacterium]